MAGKVLVNKAITPDGVTLQSRYRHEFVSHTDSDGNEYFLDGGIDYVRYGGDLTFIRITDDMPIKEIREHFDWGSYGKDGHDELHYILLKDMEADHIKAILNLDYIGESTRSVLIRELEYRGII